METRNHSFPHIMSIYTTYTTDDGVNEETYYLTLEPKDTRANSYYRLDTIIENNTLTQASTLLTEQLDNIYRSLIAIVDIKFDIKDSNQIIVSAKDLYAARVNNSNIKVFSEDKLDIEPENEINFSLPLSLNVKLVNSKDLTFNLSEDGSEYHHIKDTWDPFAYILNENFRTFFKNSLPKMIINYNLFMNNTSSIVIPAIDYLYWKDKIDGLEFKISAGKEVKSVKKTNLLKTQTELSTILADKTFDQYLMELHANTVNVDPNKVNVPEELLIGKKKTYTFKLDSKFEKYECTDLPKPDYDRLNTTAKEDRVSCDKLFYRTNGKVWLSLFDYLKLGLNLMIIKKPESAMIQLDKNKIKELSNWYKGKKYVSPNLGALSTFSTSSEINGNKRKPEEELDTAHNKSSRNNK